VEEVSWRYCLTLIARLGPQKAGLGYLIATPHSAAIASIAAGGKLGHLLDVVVCLPRKKNYSLISGSMNKGAMNISHS
jgi:hypothetical protein